MQGAKCTSVMRRWPALQKAIQYIAIYVFRPGYRGISAHRVLRNSSRTRLPNFGSGLVTSCSHCFFRQSCSLDLKDDCTGLSSVLLAACRELGGGGGGWGHHHHGHATEHELHGGGPDAGTRRQLSSDSKKLSITLRLAGGGRVSTSGTSKSGWLQVWPYGTQDDDGPHSFRIVFLCV
jgi:hypothetical protein